MDEFKDDNNELSGAFTGKVKDALEELAKPAVPDGLALKLKEIPYQNLGGWGFRVPALASILFVLIFSVLLFQKNGAKEFAGYENDAFVEASFSAYEGEDIFDDSLNDMEELLWSA